MLRSCHADATNDDASIVIPTESVMGDEAGLVADTQETPAMAQGDAAIARRADVRGRRAA